MTARPQDVALLPLPASSWQLLHDDAAGTEIAPPTPFWNADKMAAYTRANVTAALASAQAREEELRAEVAENEGAIRVWRRRCTKAEARAERLAEALREWWEMKRPLKWSEAQHRETPCVNCATEADYRLAKLAALSTNAATQTGETNEAAE